MTRSSYGILLPQIARILVLASCAVSIWAFVMAMIYVHQLCNAINFFIAVRDRENMGLD